MKRLKIGVIGGHAVGAVVATKLASNGYNVEMTKKKDNDLVIDNSVAMQIGGAFGAVNYLVPVVEDHQFTSKKDVIFVCIGAYNMRKCLEAAKDQVKPGGMIVAIQTIITMDELIETIPVDQIIMWYMDWNSVRITPQEMFVAHGGNNYIGGFSRQIGKKLKLVKTLLDCISPTYIVEDFPEFVISRFILNSTLQCIGALTGRSIGGFLADKQGKRLFLEVIKEKVAVTRAGGINVIPYDNTFDYDKFIADGISGIMYRKTMFSRLILKNGAHVSRALRRLEQNKRTEIDWLLKITLDKGKKYGVHVPYSTVLYELLCEIIAGERTICMENLLDERFIQLKEK